MLVLQLPRTKQRQSGGFGMAEAAPATVRRQRPFMQPVKYLVNNYTIPEINFE